MRIKTSITQTKDGQEIIRGKKLEELVKKHSFTESIFLIFTGRLPKKNEARMFDAILTSAIDHGPAVTSALNARLSASAKNSTHTALAAGILGFGERHGIATEGAMGFFKEQRARNKEQGTKTQDIVLELKEKKIRVPGFGHKVLAKDYRSELLMKIAKQQNIFGEHCQLAIAFEKELSKISSKPLPLNIDGAIAAILCDMGFDSRLGQSVFLVARVPGLLAHIFEEVSNDVGIRRLEDDEVEFM